ncbi:hypothetical protein ACIO6T_44195 [Streptomyces sp. NPDC087532]|uniref:hypothetical protein n=1 Tax=Streptomyces sp. NPDC087532 TaxID=3365795 RepID=UPI0038273FFB
MNFPGTRPIQGDRVDLTAEGTSLTAVGPIVVQGVLKDGRGFVELVLPDADPQQRRDLEKATQFQYWLYRDGALLYASPPLQMRDLRRATDDGALILTGSP